MVDARAHQSKCQRADPRSHAAPRLRAHAEGRGHRAAGLRRGEPHVYALLVAGQCQHDAARDAGRHRRPVRVDQGRYVEGRAAQPRLSQDQPARPRADIGL